MRAAALLCLLALLAAGPDAAWAVPVARTGDLVPLPAPAPVTAPAPRHPGRPVLVYTTHRRERYDDGATVGEAAALLAAALQHVGFRRVTLAPGGGAGPLAYLQTRATVARYAWQNPAWLIDVHRDDVPPGVYRGAQILLVVGTRNVLAWRSLPRARALAAALAAEAPGLLRGIYLGPGDYNQDLSPSAVLVELGNRDSTRAEVAAAVPPLARALAAAAP
jgi:stage II sporulation protein P